MTNEDLKTKYGTTVMNSFIKKEISLEHKDTLMNALLPRFESQWYEEAPYIGMSYETHLKTRIAQLTTNAATLQKQYYAIKALLEQEPSLKINANESLFTANS